MPLVPFPADALPITDGTTVAIWRSQSAGDRTLRVLDERRSLDETRTLPAPSCRPAATDGERLALDCQRNGYDEGSYRLASLADGAETVPAGNAQVQRDIGRYGANPRSLVTLTGLGRRLVEFSFNGRTGDVTLRYDATTGRIARGRRDVPSVSSLDSARGSVPLCRGLRISSHLEMPFITMVRVPDLAAYQRKRLLLRHGSEMRLATCGRRGFRVLGQATAMVPVLTRRYAAWTTRSRLYVYGLRTGRTQSYPLTPSVNQLEVPRLVGTDHRLWIDDTDGIRVLAL